VEKLAQKGADNDYVSLRLSRLHKVLDEQLDIAAASYRIEGGRGRGYRLQLAPEAIRFAPIAPDGSGDADG
jgi:hypothetical protein